MHNRPVCLKQQPCLVRNRFSRTYVEVQIKIRICDPVMTHLLHNGWWVTMSGALSLEWKLWTTDHCVAGEDNYKWHKDSMAIEILLCRNKWTHKPRGGVKLIVKDDVPFTALTLTKQRWQRWHWSVFCPVHAWEDSTDSFPILSLNSEGDTSCRTPQLPWWTPISNKVVPLFKKFQRIKKCFWRKILRFYRSFESQTVKSCLLAKMNKVCTQFVILFHNSSNFLLRIWPYLSCILPKSLTLSFDS